MGIKRFRQDIIHVRLTTDKLYYSILRFLTAHEADMVADFRPDNEAWRQILAHSLADHIAECCNVPSDKS